MRIIALEKYAPNATGMAEAARRLATSVSGTDALFIPYEADVLPRLAQQISSAGMN